MRLPTIRLPWSWPVKSVSPSVPSAEEQRYLDAFTAGYTLAMTHGLSQLEQTLLDRSAQQVLDGLEDTIAQRAQAAGVVNPRPTIELQSKRSEFTLKLQQAKSDRDRQKYTDYLEAINWMLIPNGH